MTKNLLQRTLTGIIYVTLISVGILVGSYTFLCVFSVVVVLCLYEFYGLVNRSRDAKVNPVLGCIGGLLLFVISYLYASGTVGHHVFFFYLLYIVFLLVSELYSKRKDSLTHLAFSFLGQCYIALPISMLNMVAFQTDSEGFTFYYPILLLSLFVFIWINDTGAYMVGISIGKHRLFERISPKKSWEGFFGGLFFVIVAALIFAHIEPDIPSYHWIGLAIVVVVFSTWGDLVESLMKRTLDVKDSGSSLPGHGGYLDRFDSMLLAVYGMLFYVQLLIQS